MIEISIAMATCNGARFLGEQLDSLANQTAPPKELVVCDDRSSDATLEVLHSFGRSAPFPVRIFKNEERVGYASNFLKAGDLCKGDWIAFCDQDDVWDVDKLSRVSAVIDSRPKALLVAHQAEIVDAGGVKIGLWKLPIGSRRRVSGPLTYGPFWSPLGFSEVVRKSVLNVLSVSEEPIVGHDRLVFYVADMLGEIVLMPDILVSYRRHTGNTTRLIPHKNGLLGIKESLLPTSFEEMATKARTLISYIDPRAIEEEGYGADWRRAYIVYKAFVEDCLRRATLRSRRLDVHQKFVMWLTLMRRRNFGNKCFGGFGIKASAKDLIAVLVALRE